MTVAARKIDWKTWSQSRAMLPAGGPCDTYGPLDTIETVGGASVPDTYAALNRIIKDWTPCAFRLRFQALRFLIPIRGRGSTAKERK